MKNKEIKYACDHYGDFKIVDNIKRIEPTNNIITYCVGNSNDLTVEKVKEIARKVFNEIEKHIQPIKFVEVIDFTNAQIKMIFTPRNQDIDFTDETGKRIKIRSPFEFDGALGTLAIGFLPLVTAKSFSGMLIFDMDEKWAERHDWDKKEIDLWQVMIHEIMHVLGLRHSTVKEAVMYPSYSGNYRKRFLHQDDIDGMREIYKDIVTDFDKKKENPVLVSENDEKSENKETVKKTPVKNNQINKKSLIMKFIQFIRKFFMLPLMFLFISNDLFAQVDLYRPNVKNDTISITQLKKGEVYKLDIFQKMKSNPNQKYKPFTKAKILGYSLLAVGGTFDGMLEGYQFDGRKSFERKWGVEPESYFGSLSWKTAYQNNTVNQGFKSPYREWRGANDFYHLADDVRKIGYISGGVAIGLSSYNQNSKWWHYALDILISSTISSSSKAIGVKWIRN